MAYPDFYLGAAHLSGIAEVRVVRWRAVRPCPPSHSAVGDAKVVVGSALQPRAGSLSDFPPTPAPDMVIHVSTHRLVAREPGHTEVIGVRVRLH